VASTEYFWNALNRLTPADTAAANDELPSASAVVFDFIDAGPWLSANSERRDWQPAEGGEYVGPLWFLQLTRAIST